MLRKNILFILKYCFIIFVVLQFTPFPILGLTSINYSKVYKKLHFEGEYGQFLKDRFGTNKKINFQGAAVGMYFQFGKGNNFLIEYEAIHADTGFTTLSLEELENSFSITSILFIYRKLITPIFFFDFFLKGGVGVESLEANIYGFTDDNISANNMLSKSGKAKNKTDSTKWLFGPSFCLCVDPIELLFEVMYLRSSHFIDSSQNRAALTKKNTAKSSNLLITGFSTSLGITFIF